MKCFSSRNLENIASFEDALFHGLASDGGLYVPDTLPSLPANWQALALHDLAFQLMHECIPDIPENDMRAIIERTLSFPLPLIDLGDQLYLLELFHGPTLSFKDVGARFMANTMSYYLGKNHQSMSVIVATSGDTGSAIAEAFHHIPHLNVFILYPSQQISHLQEKQMTTLGDNVHAIEVKGSFDDCQKLVKQALSDTELTKIINLTTANSINIARLLPQMIYHGFSVSSLKQLGNNVNPILCVPSGNLGNLTAAIYAKKMGFPIEHTIAATNTNIVFPTYLQSGKFSPAESKHTLSNAMDVGNPSNFERLNTLYHHEAAEMRADITGITISDEETLAEIHHTFEHKGYIIDPHTAVGLAAAKQYRMTSPNSPIIVSATAHPAKFPETIKLALNIDIELPDTLKQAMSRSKQSIILNNNYADLASILKKYSSA